MKHLLRQFAPTIARHGSVALARHTLARRHGERWHHELSPTLFVDVSVLAKHDARTGIQRIVRGVLQSLLTNPAFTEVRLICASHKNGYRRANWDAERQCVVVDPGAEKVHLSTGDIFLALDLAAHLLPRHLSLLAKWKTRGARIVPLVYDLLPETNPEWFAAKTVGHYRRWLRACAKLADGFVTISEAVKNDLQAWLSNQGVNVADVPIMAIRLAGEMEQSYPSRGLPDRSAALLAHFRAAPTVLMVGTIEPRKGHAEALSALECLWNAGRDVNLVILGKPGWMTENLQHCIATHRLKDQRLFWYSDASDEWLARLYEACNLVLITSKGEGLGLPLVEAMAKGKPVLARDLPVFREMAGDRITYFDCDSPELLAGKIVSTLTVKDTLSIDPVPSWNEGVAQLTTFLMSIGRPDISNDRGTALSPTQMLDAKK